MTSYTSFFGNNQDFSTQYFRMRLLQTMQLVFYESVGKNEFFCFNSPIPPDPYEIDTGRDPKHRTNLIVSY
jgi:hypothetical protein